jgi:hypothetical protein
MKQKEAEQGRVSSPDPSPKDEKTKRVLSVLSEDELNSVIERLESSDDRSTELTKPAKYALLLICSLVAADAQVGEGAVEVIAELEQEDDRTEAEKSDDETTAELANEIKSKHLLFIAEGNMTVLEILADLLPEFEPDKFGKSEPDVEAAVIKYAKSHDCFKAEGWAATLIHTLKNCVNTMKEWDTSWHKDALAKLSTETADMVQRRTQVQTAEARFASICEGLDLRTKFMITVGEELSSLSGLNIECFADVWYGLRSDDIVAEVKKDPVLSKDDDIRFLCDTYDLANSILSAS